MPLYFGDNLYDISKCHWDHLSSFERKCIVHGIPVENLRRYKWHSNDLDLAEFYYKHMKRRQICNIRRRESEHFMGTLGQYLH